MENDANDFGAPVEKPYGRRYQVNERRGGLNRFVVQMGVASQPVKIPMVGMAYLQVIDQSGLVAPTGAEIAIGSQDCWVALVPGRVYSCATMQPAWVRNTTAGASAVFFVGLDVLPVESPVVGMSASPGVLAMPDRFQGVPVVGLSHAGNNSPRLYGSPLLSSPAGVQTVVPALDAAAGASFWAQNAGQVTIVAAGSGLAASIVLSVANFLNFWAKIYIGLSCTTAGQVRVQLRVNGATIAERRFYQAAAGFIHLPLFDDLLSGVGADTNVVDVNCISNVLWAGDASATLLLTSR